MKRLTDSQIRVLDTIRQQQQTRVLDHPSIEVLIARGLVMKAPIPARGVAPCNYLLTEAGRAVYGGSL